MSESSKKTRKRNGTACPPSSRKNNIIKRSGFRVRGAGVTRNSTGRKRVFSAASLLRLLQTSWLLSQGVCSPPLARVVRPWVSRITHARVSSDQAFFTPAHPLSARVLDPLYLLPLFPLLPSPVSRTLFAATFPYHHKVGHVCFSAKCTRYSQVQGT